MNSSIWESDSAFRFIYTDLVMEYIPEYFKDWQYHPWIFSVLGSILIGLSGVLPLLIIPLEGGEHFKSGGGGKLLRVLLSFAVGGLLGDVFLHLLPEAWENYSNKGDSGGGSPSMTCGCWVLAGLLLFTMVEKLFAGYMEDDDVSEEKTERKRKKMSKINCLIKNNNVLRARNENGRFSTSKCSGGQNGKMCDIEVINGAIKNGCCMVEELEKEAVSNKSKHVSGYLNLMANSIDNFTHGLAVGGSFIVSFKLGILTTFAILVHEIPHEVGDFAILLRSGFSRWDAARAQLMTAGAGLLGAMTAIGGSRATSAMEARTCWIMPFTAGGFLHISLVTVLPDLLQERDPKESIKQFGALIGGIVLMASLTTLLE
ncbi:zinc transporter ZIP13 homolog isoform X2 [Ctenocephalides felis]|uniref:zinc transporter ZIP13 homolog isoform X2 n=1 Tax=Ctenocephalides felis TaxID=7515 RepID=UPI000E6E42D3|nr:zinc transporter ZIP13 homolog isoform X2 [Ctenocephalides felis]